MSVAFFGLDIGSTSIKAVQLGKIGKGFKLIAAGTTATPPKIFVSESSLDQEVAASAIKKLVRDAKITTRYVNTALAESQIFTQVIEMPVLSDKELASAIRWEAEQYIPIPLASATFDFQVLTRPLMSTGAPEGKMEVLLVAAPTPLVEKYVKILDLAGLTLVSLETEILAASRALSSPDSPTTLIINIGAGTTDLSVIKKGIISFTHSIGTGGTALARAVAAELGLEPSQAEEYKKTYGLEEEKLEGKILKAVKPVMNTLIEEIKKAIAFYQEKHPQEEGVKRIVLCGGTAKLPGIAVFLAESLNLEVQIGDPWVNIEKDEKLFPEITEDAPLYAVAVGLALKVI